MRDSENSYNLTPFECECHLDLTAVLDISKGSHGREAFGVKSFPGAFHG